MNNLYPWQSLNCFENIKRIQGHNFFGDSQFSYTCHEVLEIIELLPLLDFFST